MKEKVAIPLEGHGNGPRAVVLLNNGERMTRAEAVRKGWKIYGDPEAVIVGDEPAARRAAHLSWRGAVLALPEARERESAAVEIVMTQTEDTMSVASARAFLRGLPTENKEQPNVTTSNTDPHAARKAEIAHSMAAFNASNGYRPTTKSAPSSPSLAGIDPTRLKRLAEIRLNALENGQANPVANNEAKNLRYALQVHSQSGLPLANVFAQLGINTSKLTRV